MDVSTEAPPTCSLKLLFARDSQSEQSWVKVVVLKLWDRPHPGAQSHCRWDCYFQLAFLFIVND